MIYESNPSSAEWFLFWYFMGINIVYSVLLALGALHIYRRRKELSVEDFTYLLQANSLPEITCIIPMYNEEKNIQGCLDSLLHLTYRYKRLIAVNDGSNDQTLDFLKTTYNLVSIPQFFKSVIPTAQIREVYQSRTFPELVVIDKDHAGKYDTVNAGINAAQSTYFISVDADVFIDNKGFEGLIRPLLANPDAIGIGASVRIKNGCTFDFNQINTKQISFHPIPIFQGLEYLRSFLQRQGWNYLGGNFVIAGAFSIFPTELILKTGGFSKSVAEDMEIVVRLNHLMKYLKKPFKIFYLPDPIAWTEGPETLSRLGRQRTRWHLGLLETIWIHKTMCLNPRYGIYGLFNFPFWVLGEAIEPVMEAAGYLFIFFAWFFGFLNVNFALLLFMITLGFTFVYSLICLLIEELGFRKYISLKTILVMFVLSLIENCGYRQLTIHWRIRSFIQFFMKFKQIKREARRIQTMVEK